MFVVGPYCGDLKDHSYIFYVGKATNIRKRYSEYLQEKVGKGANPREQIVLFLNDFDGYLQFHYTPVPKEDLMSEDNGVAIVTRRLIREHPLFNKRIKVMTIGKKNSKPKLAISNVMSAADRPYLMAIETFRKCNQHILPKYLASEFSLDQQKPSFDSLESAFSKMSGLWNTMIEAVEPWKALLDPEVYADKWRTAAGGHTLVRPIGITAFVAAFGSAPEIGVKHLRTVVSQFHDLASPPWRGVLWNSATNRMANTVEAEKLARRLWRYLLGLDEDKGALETDWRAHIDPGGEGPRLRLPTPPARSSK
jgi:hypothetical protein